MNHRMLTAVPGGNAKLPSRPELLNWVHELTEQVAPGDLTDHELLELVAILLDAGNRKHRRHLQLVDGHNEAQLSATDAAGPSPVPQGRGSGVVL